MTVPARPGPNSIVTGSPLAWARRPMWRLIRVDAVWYASRYCWNSTGPSGGIVHLLARYGGSHPHAVTVALPSTQRDFSVQPAGDQKRAVAPRQSADNSAVRALTGPNGTRHSCRRLLNALAPRTPWSRRLTLKITCVSPARLESRFTGATSSRSSASLYS